MKECAMWKLILFSKAFKDKRIEELVTLAHNFKFDGYDLCVRPGYPINPENAAEKLPQIARLMNEEGLVIPMITGNFDLLYPDHPTAEPILSAMEKANIRLIKLGYYLFDPERQDYWQEVDKIRKAFEGWQRLGKRYNVKICYHTHSNRCMGLNCAALAHLLNGFDPDYLGAYIDPGHMVVEGEEFSVGCAMIKKYLSIVALKDVLITREEYQEHGRCKYLWVPAGKGMVNWTAVFSELKRIGYQGPLSVHCEFEVPEERFFDAVREEIEFFRTKRNSL